MTSVDGNGEAQGGIVLNEGGLTIGRTGFFRYECQDLAAHLKRLEALDHLMAYVKDLGEQVLVKDLGERELPPLEPHGDFNFSGNPNLTGKRFRTERGFVRMRDMCPDIMHFMHAFVETSLDAFRDETGLPRPSKITLTMRRRERNHGREQPGMRLHVDVYDEGDREDLIFQNGHMLSFFWSDVQPTEFLKCRDMDAVKKRAMLFEKVKRMGEEITDEDEMESFPERHLVMANGWAMHRRPKHPAWESRDGTFIVLLVPLIHLIVREGKRTFCGKKVSHIRNDFMKAYSRMYGPGANDGEGVVKHYGPRVKLQSDGGHG